MGIPGLRASHTIPVTEGERVNVTIKGKAKEDYFGTYHGFVIFIKGVPEHSEGKELRILIKAVQKNYGFAEYSP